MRRRIPARHVQLPPQDGSERETKINALVRQFLRFAGVGAITFFVDAGVLTAALAIAPGRFYLGRAVSYTAAATMGWWLNRRYTFGHGGTRWRQWLRYLVANLSGGLANYAVYAALIALSSLCRAYPAAAVAAGSLTGLLLNFAASRRFVFTG
jgi:putative flippase GtrA